MAKQAYEALKQQAPDELQKSLITIERELQGLRFKLALKDLEDTSQFKKLRHRRAQILTVLRLAPQPVHVADQEPAVLPPAAPASVSAKPHKV